MAESNQSQKAGEGALQIQAGGSVTITLGVSYADLDASINTARKEIAQEVLSKVQGMLEVAGVQPRSAQIKTIVPILQYASLEEDPDLQNRWAGLLANAVDPRLRVEVPPSFPDILRQLAPWDARFMDGIFERFCAKCPVSPPTAGWTGTVELGKYRAIKRIWDSLGFERVPVLQDYASTERILDLTDSRLRVSLDNLVRLNLLTRRPVKRRDDGASSPEDYEFSPTDYYTLTALGFEFVIACRRPEAET